jgi:hypothetical protein
VAVLFIGYVSEIIREKYHQKRHFFQNIADNCNRGEKREMIWAMK